MPTMRIGALNQRDRVPWVVRSRFERTFLGLGMFAAVSPFLWGAYLLMEALGDPLRATGVAVLDAGWMLALASFLLVFLLWPRGETALARTEDPNGDFEYSNGPVLTVSGEAAQDQPAARQAVREGKIPPRPI